MSITKYCQFNLPHPRNTASLEHVVHLLFMGKAVNKGHVDSPAAANLFDGSSTCRKKHNSQNTLGSFH